MGSLSLYWPSLVVREGWRPGPREPRGSGHPWPPRAAASAGHAARVHEFALGQRQSGCGPVQVVPCAGVFSERLNFFSRGGPWPAAGRLAPPTVPHVTMRD